MDDHRPGDVPRLWREQPPLPNYPVDPVPTYSPPELPPPEARPGSWGGWFAYLSPMQQLGYGCIGIFVISTLFLYCVGASTFFVRPMLQGRAVPTPTEVVPPTAVRTATPPPQPTSIIPLPTVRGTMLATPTQAPLPTRAPWTATATFDPNHPYTPTFDPGHLSTLTPTKKSGTTLIPTTIPTVKR